MRCPLRLAVWAFEGRRTSRPTQPSNAAVQRGAFTAAAAPSLDSRQSVGLCLKCGRWFGFGIGESMQPPKTSTAGRGSDIGDPGIVEAENHVIMLGRRVAFASRVFVGETHAVEPGRGGLDEWFNSVGVLRPPSPPPPSPPPSSRSRTPNTLTHNPPLPFNDTRESVQGCYAAVPRHDEHNHKHAAFDARRHRPQPEQWPHRFHSPRPFVRRQVSKDVSAARFYDSAAVQSHPQRQRNNSNSSNSSNSSNNNSRRIHQRVAAPVHPAAHHIHRGTLGIPQRS
ncbi:hypothetical protein L1887_48450 [Cichorium endivia]|nr:hypothetical protein L1887_48450 [Cichorium endivia]